MRIREVRAIGADFDRPNELCDVCRDVVLQMRRNAFRFAFWLV
jgi:hypothetical protein